MRFAYADPPYPGCIGKYSDSDGPYRAEVNHPLLVAHLLDEFPDGWALSTGEPSLRYVLNLCPDDVRVCVWVKPFASFKPGVTLAYTWEPVILYGGRRRSRSEATVRDHLSEPITLKKGLAGAKPRRFCSWVLDLLGWQPGDELVDLFPGSGVMGEVVAGREDAPVQDGLFALEEAS